MFKNKITKEANITGDYIAKKKVIDAFGKDTVNFWHLSIGEISKHISNAGFLIVEIVEPIPGNRIKELRPETYKRLQKIPEFIIFKLIKII